MSRHPSVDMQVMADGTVVGAAVSHASTVYLDTGDLSVLALGRLGTDEARVLRWRERLRALLVAGRARLVVSDMALIELAKRPEVFEAAVPLLRDVPNVMRVTDPNAVFAAELRGEPVAMGLVALDPAALASFRMPTRVPGLYLTAARLAWLWHWLGRYWARADDLARAARRREGDRYDGGKMAAALLRGEVPDGVPLFVRPFAAAYAAFARYAHRRGGRLGDAFAAGAPSDGMTWVRSVAPDATVPAGPPGTWSVEDVRRLPSCALRGAVEAARHRDLTRPWGRGTLADLLHLAFVGHVDVATVDKTTFALTEPVRRRLHGTAIFRNGKLDRVLDHLEHETEGRP